MQISASVKINAGELKQGDLTFSRASQGTRVNKVGQVETIANDMVRFDHYPQMSMVGIRRGYLLEESSTNSSLYSQDFSNAVWAMTAANHTNQGSVSANGVDWMAPDGLFTGDYLNCATTGTGIVAARQTGITYTNGEKYTVSVWARKVLGYDYLEISNMDQAGASMTFSKTFNLATGVVGSASGGTVYSASIEEYSGGWYRCAVTFTADSNSAGEIYYGARNDDAVNTESSHTAGNKIHLWGSQIEMLPYKTSYIPTTDSSYVREADVAVVNNTDSYWNWNAGLTLWVDYQPLNTTETITPILHYADTNNTNYMTLLSDGSLKVASNASEQLAVGGSGTFDASRPHVSGTQYRSILTAKTDNFHYASNGELSPNLPDTSITVPLKTTVSMYSAKFFHGTGYSSGSGWLKGFMIYPQHFSDADLQNNSVAIDTSMSVLKIGSTGTVANASISESKLASGSVTVTKIGANAISESKIQDNAVTPNKLVADIITADKIADNAIQNEHLKANSITSDKIAFDVIVADDIANNAITFAELSADAVQTASILDANVTTAKIADLNVTTAKIADLNVTTAKIADGDITNAKLAPNSVETSNIASSQVVTGSIAALNITEALLGVDSVSTDKIVDLNVTAGKLGSNSVIEVKIADAAVTNAKLATNAVSTTRIGDLQVTEAKIADGSITAAKIANGTIIEQELADNSVTALKLADNAVDTNAIVDLNVTEGKLADGCVTNAKLGANSITSDKIMFDIIVADDIADNAVTFAELANDAVRTAKIQDGAVTGTKIELTGNVAGDIMYYDGADWVVLHPSSGSYLQSNGAGQPVSWASSATLAIALGG